MVQNIDIKANKHKGMAKKGSLRKTITVLSNYPASDANKKTTKIMIIFNNNRYEDTKFDKALNAYYPISVLDTREQQLRAYHRDRYNKVPSIIRAFRNC